MLGILSLAAVGSVFVNTLSGTGATGFGLVLQTVTVTFYLSFIYYITNHTSLGINWVWTGEVLYWVLMLLMVVAYLRSSRWHDVHF